MRRRDSLALLALALAGATVPAWAEAPAEPEGYRLDNYKAPTPRTLHGATVLATPAAGELWHAGQTVFVDVLPHPPKPVDLPAGTIWRDPPHETIAGAVWLPDVGQGALAAVTEDYFKRNLADLTKGDRGRPLLFFCRKDCWMSWNAAKRALGYGYQRIYWYSEGVDGWKAAALPMETVQPRP
ncbi:hypothetical protein LMIY3S_02090 [Labrys miyagiensis]